MSNLMCLNNVHALKKKQKTTLFPHYLTLNQTTFTNLEHT